MYNQHWTHSTDIAGYTYAAANYCNGDCVIHALPTGPGETYDGWAEPNGPTEATETTLNEIAQTFGIDRDDETTFDSHDFPKVIFHSMVEDAEHCDGCGGEL